MSTGPPVHQVTTSGSCIGTCAGRGEKPPIEIILGSNLISKRFLQWPSFCAWTGDGFVEQRKPVLISATISHLFSDGSNFPVFTVGSLWSLEKSNPVSPSVTSGAPGAQPPCQQRCYFEARGSAGGQVGGCGGVCPEKGVSSALSAGAGRPSSRSAPGRSQCGHSRRLWISSLNIRGMCSKSCCHGCGSVSS